MKNKKYAASFALLITALIWGLSYIGVEDALNNGCGAFPILFLRSFVAGFILVWFTIKKNYKNRGLFINGMLCGLFAFLGLAVQTYGQKLTTVSSTAFITSLYIIFVPVLTRVFFKKRESLLVYISCIISVIGCFLLNLEWPLSFSRDNWLGNVLVLLSAIFFALQILFISKGTKKYNILQITTVELFTMAFLSLVAMSLIGDFSFHTQGLSSVILVAIFSSGISGVLQMWGQKYLPESVSGIIMGLEAIFATIFAFLIYHETMNCIQIIGCVLIFMPLILIQLPYKKKKELSLPIEEEISDET